VYHLPYYQEHFDRTGFEKENDWLEFRLTISPKALDKGTRGAEIIKRRFGFEVKNIETKKEMKEVAPIIFEILNEAFSDLPYVSKLTPNMINLYLEKYLDVLDPRFITLVTKNEKIIGFFVGLPNLSEAMQKTKGKLYPFGFTHIMKALKKPKVIDMMLTGVRPEYQNSGVAVILIGELQNKMMKLGIDQMETTGVFETNHAVIGNWKNYEHIQHKRRRCYVKAI
jgi:ribosomal protein S18 acetylase RimI-like enzyme